MGLVIISNKSDGHLGTLDREMAQKISADQGDDPWDQILAKPAPPYFYDHPGKHAGIDRALQQFVDATEKGDFKNSTQEPYPPAIKLASNGAVADEDILKVHSAAALERLRRHSEEASQRTPPLVFEDNVEAHISPGTYRAARSAVKAVLDAVDRTLHGEDTTTIANVWPPGHHAESSRHAGQDTFMGFCYLSNVAIGALYARDHVIRLDPSRGANRVLVIDIDNHEGNGTATALAGEENVLVVDLVQRSPFREGHYVDGYFDTTTGARLGQSTEFPAHHRDEAMCTSEHPRIYAPNLMYLDFEKQDSPRTATREDACSGRLAAVNPEVILERFVREALPAIRRFAPNVIMWSLGVDSAQNDPLGGMGHIPGSFYTLIRGVRLACPEAKQIGATEGGYLESNWAPCFQPIAAALHGTPDDAKNHSTLFARFAAAFAGNLGERVLGIELAGLARILREPTTATEAPRPFPLNDEDLRTVRVLIRRGGDRSALHDMQTAIESNLRCVSDDTELRQRYSQLLMDLRKRTAVSDESQAR